MATKSKAVVTPQAVLNAVAPVLARLYERWVDEAQYENIADYGVVIAKHLPAGVTLVGMHKRPFGFTFTDNVGLQKFTIMCRAKGNRLDISMYET